MHASPANQRKRLAEGAPGVEVGRERDGGTGIHERPCGWHRTSEEQCARGQEDRNDVTLPECRDTVRTGGLEMIDRPRTELDREPDRTQLRELIAVQPELEPGTTTGREIFTRLSDVERTALDKDIGRLRKPRSFRQDLTHQELDVRISSLPLELRRKCVRTEPGGNATCVAHDAELSELGLAIEPVPRLRLERRRPGPVIQSRWRARAARKPTSPAARVARTVERMPPPAACSSS